MLKRLRFLPIVTILAAMLFIALSPFGKTEAANKIADGVFLGDKDLSGMTLNEAADAMEEYYERVAASDLTINIRKIPDDVLAKMEAGEKVNMDEYAILSSVKVPVAEFGFDYSIEEALRLASTVGQTGKLVERYKTLMDMKYASAQLPLSYSIDGEAVKNYVEKTFVPENTKDAVDAKFSWGRGGFTCIQRDQDGIKVNANLTANSILQAFESGISDQLVCSAAVSTVPAKVTADSMDGLTFSMVATASTSFWRGGDESNASRAHNIDRAAELVNGTLVMPGQRVSLNQTIGQRTVERGFSIGHAYQNGQVIDEIGGGICQFATTLYQCLLKTELQVNVRHAHSMEVVYVPYSQDATLDWPGTDLIFTNSWDQPIYIECSTGVGSVTVSFYGVDPRPKNRTIEYKTVIDNVKKTLYPKINLDKDKAPGYATSDGGHTDAVNSHLDKIVRVNGQIQSTTTLHHDYYRPLRVNVYVGCKGLNLTVRRENEIDKIYDGSGNQLLLNGKYEPIYNGRGGYYLAKDYQHDANGVAIYSGGKLVPIGGGTTPTQPPTTEAPTQPSHTHSYGNWTSNNNGTHSRSCTAGDDTQTENCTYSNGVCTVCGYEQPSTEHTHSYGSWTSNNNGTHSRSCTAGDDTQTENCTYSNGVCTVCGYAQPHEHSYGNWTSNGNGTHSRSCTAGDDTQTENCSYTDVVTSPTTSSQGYTTHTCTVCGYSFVDSYTDPLPETPADPNPGEGGEGNP